MKLRQVMAASLAAVLAIGGSPILLAQQGALGGKATDEAKRPYTDYSVRLREPQTGQVFGTQTLDTDGQFSFTGLTLGQNYIVELVAGNNNRVVCTEGPFSLSQARSSMTDVNIECGNRTATALWLLAAAAGLTTAGVAAAGDDTPAPQGVPTTFGGFSQSNSR